MALDLPPSGATGASELIAAVDRLQDGLAITDAGGLFTYMNPSHAAMFDYGSPAELIGKPWTTIYQPEIADWFQQFVMPRLFSNGAWRGEAVGISAFGRLVPQEVSLTVSAAGGIICATRDIKARKKDEASLELLRNWLSGAELQAQVQRKLDRTCHDIANFLLAADAQLAAAQALAGDDERLAPHIERIGRALTGARETAASALSKSTGSSDPPPSLDLVALATRAADLAAREDGGPGRLQVRTDLIAAFGDVDSIVFMRALTNLLRNALEAGGEGDVELTVAATAPAFPFADAPRWRSRDVLPDNCVAISIRDTGCGIEPDHLSQIFNAFFSTKTGMRGATRGLGLDAVMELVTRATGVVSVQSLRGFGSQFDLILPVSELIPQIAAPPRSLEGLGHTVAIVDDDPLWRDRIERDLAARSFTIARFTRPEEALAAICEGNLDPSCIVIDFHFGGASVFDGAELATRIAAFDEEIPLVCFSSVRPTGAMAFHEALDKRDGVEALGDAVSRLANAQLDHATA